MQRVRIRMYQVGFGDCFLISMGNSGHARHLLLDCGVHSRGQIAPHDGKGASRMEQVVRNIREETGGKLAVVIASHRHQDHISGFGDFLEEFRSFHIDEVWLPWTEDPDDPQAAGLRRQQRALLQLIEGHLAARAKAAAEGAPPSAVSSALEAVCLNMRPNDVALTGLRQAFGNTRAHVRYLSAGEKLRAPADLDGLRVSVLGPPRSPEYLRRMNPPRDQVYEAAPAGGPGSRLEPFLEARSAARWDQLSQDTRDYWASAAPGVVGKLAEVEGALEHAAENMLEAAFALDQAVNNTSLSLLLAYQDQYLLLPGDAQWGNWMYWLEQEGAADVLSKVTFLKVAHHGSHNATPRLALDRMTEKKFAAMVSTQDTPWDTIPQQALIAELNRRSRAVARSDQPPARGQRRPFKSGRFWIDYSIDLGAKRRVRAPTLAVASPAGKEVLAGGTRSRAPSRARRPGVPAHPPRRSTRRR